MGRVKLRRVRKWEKVALTSERDVPVLFMATTLDFFLSDSILNKKNAACAADKHINCSTKLAECGLYANEVGKWKTKWARATSTTETLLFECCLLFVAERINKSAFTK